MGHDNSVTIVSVFAIILLAFVGIVTMASVMSAKGSKAVEGFEDATIYDQTLAPVLDENTRPVGDIIRGRLEDLDANIPYQGAYTTAHVDQFKKSLIETSVDGIVYKDSFKEYSQPLALDEAVPLDFITLAIPDPDNVYNGY